MLPLQWNQPMTGWMTSPVQLDLDRKRNAAMEPTENRPDAYVMGGDAHYLAQPQWSLPGPADDDAAVHGARRRYEAAMEPAEDRLGDQDVESEARHELRAAAMEPAENRPGDYVLAGMPWDVWMPQWSQPRTGWVTFPVDGQAPCLVAAAMEPAEDRLGDSVSAARDPDIERAAMEPAEDRLGDTDGLQ